MRRRERERDRERGRDNRPKGEKGEERAVGVQIDCVFLKLYEFDFFDICHPAFSLFATRLFRYVALGEVSAVTKGVQKNMSVYSLLRQPYATFLCRD